MKLFSIKIAAASITFVALQGCAAMGGSGPDASSLASADWNSMSCGEIDARFAEYRQSVEDSQQFNGLVGLVSSDAESASREGASAAMQAYYQAKDSVEPVLMAKGCQDVTI